MAGIVCNLRDITELRDAQDDVVRNARRFEAILANLSDLASVIDADGKMTYVSPAAQRLVGRQADGRLGASIFDFVHPDDVPRALEELAQGLANRRRTTQFDARVLHDDGSYRTFEVRANNMLHDPAVNGIIVSSRDVTDRVNAEKARYESERLYRTIVETANEGIWIIDENAITTFANGRMAEMFGYPAEAVIGRHIFEFLDEEGRTTAARNLDRRRAGIAGQHDVQLQRGDGGTFWAMVSAAPFIDDDGTYRGAIALVTDITERLKSEADLRTAELERLQQEAELDRHRLEAELQQTRRLESIGRLAAGVAHDFNNLVGVILNYATAAAKQLDPTSPPAGDIAQIRHAAEQAAEVTRKLLTFGRADPVHPEVINLNELIVSVARLVDRSFGDGIVVTTQLAAEGCFIEADRGQVEQLLMNLLMNARDALPSGGTITVNTKQVDAASTGPDPAPPSVVMTVADDGAGMTPEVRERAFEPFFTTKTSERGTGLGLATVHSIVTRANGHVSIESAPHLGTTVRVRFPSR